MPQIKMFFRNLIFLLILKPSSLNLSLAKKKNKTTTTNNLIFKHGLIVIPISLAMVPSSFSLFSALQTHSICKVNGKYVSYTFLTKLFLSQLSLITREQFLLRDFPQQRRELEDCRVLWETKQNPSWVISRKCPQVTESIYSPSV